MERELKPMVIEVSSTSEPSDVIIASPCLIEEEIESLELKQTEEESKAMAQARKKPVHMVGSTLVPLFGLGPVLNPAQNPPITNP